MPCMDVHMLAFSVSQLKSHSMQLTHSHASWMDAHIGLTVPSLESYSMHTASLTHSRVSWMPAYAPHPSCTEASTNSSTCTGIMCAHASKVSMVIFKWRCSLCHMSWTWTWTWTWTIPSVDNAWNVLQCFQTFKLIVYQN